jgi:cellulose synthase (UDP-forming)
MSKLLLGLVWAIVAACVIFIVALPINLQTHLIAGAIVLTIMMTLKLLRPERDMAADRACARHGHRAALRLLAHHQHAAARQPARELHPGLSALSGRDVQRVDAGAQPVHRRHAAAARARRRPATTPTLIPSSMSSCPATTRTTSCWPTRSRRPRRWTIRRRFTVWLLDDGGTEAEAQCRNIIEARRRRSATRSLQRSARISTSNYLTRERNEHAKAGNLNNGLANSTGELVAVFDADHAPARRFPAETVGYFAEDPRCSWCRRRTSSSIPIRSSATCAPSRRCRPRTRCSTASSSAASTSGTPRSSAARPPCCAARRCRTTDGFSGRSITEDCETALELHSRGWNSVYVDKPLIAGPAAGHLRKLHRPAQPLGAGHDADPALPLSRCFKRGLSCRSAFATCRRRCSGCSRSRAPSSCSRRSSTCSSTGDLHGLGRRVPRLYAQPTWS